MREETEANKGLWFAATPQVVIKQRFKQAITNILRKFHKVETLWSIHITKTVWKLLG